MIDISRDAPPFHLVIAAAIVAAFMLLPGPVVDAGGAA